MRWLVFLLIIINAVTFSWFMFNQDQKEQRAVHQERKSFNFAKAPKVTLLQELPKSELLRRDLRHLEEQEKKRRLALAAQLQCRMIGAFNDADTAKNARQLLSYSAKEARIIKLSEPLPAMHWIYIPPEASRDEAVALSEKLQEDGIENFVLGDKDPQFQHAISLGVFSKLDSAQKELERIELKGYKPEMARKERKKDVYWLALDADRSDKLTDDMLEPLRDLNAEIKNKEKSCQSIAEFKTFQ